MLLWLIYFSRNLDKVLLQFWQELRNQFPVKKIEKEEDHFEEEEFDEATRFYWKKLRFQQGCFRL